MTRWNSRYTERQKMQHVYVAVAILATLAAGLLSLVNRDLGFATLRISLLAVVVYAVNLIVWSVLYSSLLIKLGARTPKR